jgi:DNA-binding FrmR family transcriptional regulator
VDKVKKEFLGKSLQKAGPYIGPRGGKWADPKHTIPWKETTETPKQKTVEVTIHPAISGREGHKETFRVVGEKGDTVKLSRYKESDWGPTMPKESVKHFVNDLQGKVDLPKSGRADIDAVIEGKAKLLGKGDDGLAFKVGDKVVKVSTTVPFQPENPGHRTPEQAADMLKKQVETGNMLADKGIKGIQRSEFVKHGDKGFQIKPFVEIPEKLTREQLDKIQETLHAIHDAGYAVKDDIQVGLDAKGEPVMFDVGKAAPRDDLPPDAIYGDIRGDIENLSRLYREHGQTFVNTRHSEGQKLWDKAQEMRLRDKPPPAGMVNKWLKRAAEKLREEAKATLSGDQLEDKLYDIDIQLKFNLMDEPEVKKAEPKEPEDPSLPPPDPDYDEESGEPIIDPETGMTPSEKQEAEEQGLLEPEEPEEETEKSGLKRYPVKHQDDLPIEPAPDAHTFDFPASTAEQVPDPYPSPPGPTDGYKIAKAGPFIGPRGGLWADAEHTIPWREGKGPRTGAIQIPEAKIRELTNKLLENSPTNKHGQFPKVKPGWTTTVLKDARGDEQEISIYLTPEPYEQIQDPRGISGIQQGRVMKPDGTLELNHVIRVTVPTGFAEADLPQKIRDVLSHELTHALDPSLSARTMRNAEQKLREARTQEARDREQSAREGKTYREYLNAKKEVTASLQQIVRDLTTEDLVTTMQLEQENYKKDRDFPEPMSPQQMLGFYSPRWKIVGEHYDPENRKRVLKAVAQLRNAILSGQIKGIQKALESGGNVEEVLQKAATQFEALSDPLDYDHTKETADQEARKYEQVKRELIKRGAAKPGDFEADGPLYGRSNNELINWLESLKANNGGQ